MSRMKIGCLCMVPWLLLLLMIIPVAAIPRANFQIQETEWYRSDTDDLYPGTYPALYGGSVSILNYPSTGTILGNLTYRIEADNITSYNDMQYANRVGSSIQWVFPENITLPENTYILTSFRSDYSNNRYIPMTVHRSFNKTVFSSDGYQLASFSVAFENFSYTMDDVSFDKIWGGITTSDNSNVNASIVVGSFTTDMPIFTDPQNNPQKITGHLIEFSNYSHPLQNNRLYNFSVLIYVHLKNPSGPSIEYYPTFSIALEGDRYTSDSFSSFTAVTPPSLLPKYMHYAGGSTNVSNQWSYSCNYMLGFTLNSTSHPIQNEPIANFTATPTSGTAPLTVQFTDNSTGSPTSWNWSFGDGTFSDTQNPSHIFHTAGIYTVTLTATNAGGSNTVTKTRYVTVTGSNPTVPMVSAITPTSRNAVVGSPVTVFMSVINAGTTTARGVSIAQASSLPVTVSYQQWNGVSFIGSPDTPVDIPAGGTANFVLAITPTAAFGSSPLTFTVAGTNTGGGAPIWPVNTLTMRATSTAAPDVIMMSTNYNVQIGVNVQTAFALATTNVGGAAATGVSLQVVVPSSITGLSYTVDQTNPATGAIIGPATGLTINPGAQPTFAVFLTPMSAIPVDLVNNRITVELVDGSGNVVGAQSVAVSTT
jgi:PKD repeat protein